MGIQLESVIRAIVNACQSVLPVWYGQADEGAQMPYAVMTMESSDVTILSGGHFLATLDLKLSFFQHSAIGEQSRLDLRQSIGSAMSSVQGMLSITPASAGVDILPDRKEAQDMVESRAGYTVLIQGGP